MATNAQNLLAAAKKEKAQGPRQPQNQVSKRPLAETVISASSDLTSLESLYFNPQEDVNPLTEAYEVYPNGEKREVYDPNKEMEEIKQGNYYQVQNSHLPQAILESLISKPLNVPIPDSLSENVMDEQLQNRTLDIIDKLDSRDKQSRKNIPQQPTRQTVNEQMTYSQPPVNSGVDYNMLVALIEGAIDKKFAQYSNKLLTESKGGNTPQLAFMKLGNSFTFMDSENNVYECKMIYKGKGKLNKKN